MKEIQIGGQPVAVAIHGASTATPLLLIHGAGHDHGVWDAVAPGPAAGYRVIAPDLPAHGASGGAPLPEVEKMADWVLALADALGLERFALAGHSMGSLVALATAARAPARVHALHLLGSVAPMPVAPFMLEAVRTEPPQAWALINKFSFAPAEVLGEQRRATLETENLERMQRQGAAVLASDLAACDGWQDGLRAATRVRCPVLLLSGECDRMTPPSAVTPLRDAFTGCTVQLRVLPGVGHTLMLEAPEQVVDAMRPAR